MALPQSDRMSDGEVFSYARHQPEKKLLYKLVERHWPDFQSYLSESGRVLPRHVRREFDEYLECGRLENGFLRVRCEGCHLEHLVAFSCKRRGFCPSCGASRMVETAALLVDEVLPHKPIRQWVLSFPFPLRFLLANNSSVMTSVLDIVIRAISTHLIHKAGFKKTEAQTGAVTLIQNFGSALNQNCHFHVLFIDGVYQQKNDTSLRFHRVSAPTVDELNTLVATISQRVADFLERKGLLVREDESSYLTMDWQSDDDAMEQLQSHSITYRIAVGPQQGRKVFTLQTIPAWEDEDDFGNNQVGKIAGFSLHAGVASKTRDRKKLERLCRYIARPAVSEERLALTLQGKVQYELKTPYRNGTTHVVFEPLDFMAKLAALVPKPRANLTRYHGVLAPNSMLRAQVTPARRGKSSAKEKDQKQGKEDSVEELPEPKGHEKMTWAERLKRVFNIDITVCCYCGAAVKIIACIEDPALITKILAHLDAASGAGTAESQLPESRAPPQVELFS